MVSLVDLARRMPKSGGWGLVLGSLLTLWAMEMGRTTGSGFPDGLILALCLGCSLFGWQAALGFYGPGMPARQDWVVLALLIILYVCSEGLAIVMLVAQIPWALFLANAVCVCLFLGDWIKAFAVFRGCVIRLRGWGWHLPLAVPLGAVGWWGFFSVEIWEANILLGYLTLGVYSFYLLWNLARRLGRRKPG